MFVCICKAVTEDEVHEHCAAGADSADAIGERCGAGWGMRNLRRSVEGDSGAVGRRQRGRVTKPQHN